MLVGVRIILFGMITSNYQFVDRRDLLIFIVRRFISNRFINN
jgi:hypothetical protein